MCEWEYNKYGSPKERNNNIEDNILYYWGGVVWKLTPWRHGDNCKWGQRMRSLGTLIARSQ